MLIKHALHKTRLRVRVHVCYLFEAVNHAFKLLLRQIELQQESFVLYAHLEIVILEVKQGMIPVHGRHCLDVARCLGNFIYQLILERDSDLGDGGWHVYYFFDQCLILGC